MSAAHFPPASFSLKFRICEKRSYRQMSGLRWWHCVKKTMKLWGSDSGVPNNLEPGLKGNLFWGLAIWGVAGVEKSLLILGCKIRHLQILAGKLFFEPTYKSHIKTYQNGLPIEPCRNFPPWRISDLPLFGWDCPSLIHLGFDCCSVVQAPSNIENRPRILRFQPETCGG